MSWLVVVPVENARGARNWRSDGGVTRRELALLPIEHHAPSFLEDLGWDEERRKTFERQKELGIVPSKRQLPPTWRLCLRNTFSSKGRNRIAQRWIGESSTKTPRSCIISSKWRQLNGYAAYQRMPTRMASIGKRIPLVASIVCHTRLEKGCQHRRAGGTTTNATEPFVFFRLPAAAILWTVPASSM